MCSITQLPKTTAWIKTAKWKYKVKMHTQKKKQRCPIYDSVKQSSSFILMHVLQSSRMDFTLCLPIGRRKHQMIIILTNPTSDIWILRLTWLTWFREDWYWASLVHNWLAHDRCLKFSVLHDRHNHAWFSVKIISNLRSGDDVSSCP